MSPDNGIVIYLAGPMSGVPDFNYPAFAAYTDRYRREGFTVVSPAELDGGDTSQPYETYMRRDIEAILDNQVERIYLMPGWGRSRGAKFERSLGEILNLSIYDAETGQPFSETVCQEAYRLVHGDRGQSYGHPLDDFGRTSGMLNSLLKHKLSAQLSEEDVAAIMVCVKLSREINRPGRDNVADIAGYAETWQMVKDERARRAR